MFDRLLNLQHGQWPPKDIYSGNSNDRYVWAFYRNLGQDTQHVYFMSIRTAGKLADSCRTTGYPS